MIECFSYRGEDVNAYSPWNYLLHSADYRKGRKGEVKNGSKIGIEINTTNIKDIALCTVHIISWYLKNENVGFHDTILFLKQWNRLISSVHIKSALGYFAFSRAVQFMCHILSIQFSLPRNKETKVRVEIRGSCSIPQHESVLRYRDQKRERPKRPSGW